MHKMPIQFHGSGAELLLNHIENIRMGAALREDDITSILSNPDIEIWLNAYETWIRACRITYAKILQSLHENTPKGLDRWGEHIDKGLRVAIENPDRLRNALTALSKFDWSQTAQNTLKYLPKATPLDAHVVMTIDGFNGGMYRGNYTYLSLHIIDPITMQPEYFSHEFHHAGFNFWWKQHPLVQEYGDKNGTREHWLLLLFKYFVSEGLANAFCSPKQLVKIKGESTTIMKHNSLIEEYESMCDEIFDDLLGLVRTILEGNLEDIEQLYMNLTTDMVHSMLPKGHFLSGRMIQAMEKAFTITHEEIINLVKEPFNFFHLYIDASTELGLNLIPEDLIDLVNQKVNQMSENMTLLDHT